MIMTDTFILQELITDDLPFRVHNVKIDKFIYTQDLPIMLLAHYDRLSDDIKAQKPLSDFFGRINDRVTTDEACAIFGIDHSHLHSATHLKITGTTVIVLDDFPLALHLQFTNTAKETQTLDTSDLHQALQEQIDNILLSGNVNILHKNNAKTLISIDLSDNEFVITPHEQYTRLPNAHALATTQILNHLKQTTPRAMSYLNHALHEKIMSYFNEHY